MYFSLMLYQMVCVGDWCRYQYVGFICCVVKYQVLVVCVLFQWVCVVNVLVDIWRLFVNCVQYCVRVGVKVYVGMYIVNFVYCIMGNFFDIDSGVGGDFIVN